MVCHSSEQLYDTRAAGACPVLCAHWVRLGPHDHSRSYGKVPLKLGTSMQDLLNNYFTPNNSVSALQAVRRALDRRNSPFDGWLDQSGNAKARSSDAK